LDHGDSIETRSSIEWEIRQALEEGYWRRLRGWIAPGGTLGEKSFQGQRPSLDSETGCAYLSVHYADRVAVLQLPLSPSPT
jgi:hypothetical protein